MTLLEMKDKRALLIEDNTALTLKVEKEKRELTPEEKIEFEARNEKVAQLEAAIELEEEKRKFDPKTLTFKIEKKEEKKAPSLFSAIRNLAAGKAIPADYEEINEQGERDMREASINDRKVGQLVIPATRSVVLAGQTSGTTGGGYAIATEKPYMLPPLTNYLVLKQAGATYLDNLKGFQRIPAYSGTTVYWGSEVASASNGEGTWGYVDMSPRRVTALVDISKNFLLQENVGAEEMLKANMAQAIAVSLETKILGVGAGSVIGEPTGISYGSAGAYYKHAPTAASWAAAIDLIKTVETNNALKGSLGWVTHPLAKAQFMKTAKVSSSDSEMVSNSGNELIGYPVFSTSSAPYNVFTTTGSAGLIFGNWADLLIGQWGGYDLTVDPYTQAHLGTVRLVVNCYFDAAIARSASFNVANITIS